MMAPFIAERIEEEAKVSIVSGQAKYRDYFIKTTRFLAWKADVDTILSIDGFADVIVTK